MVLVDLDDGLQWDEGLYILAQTFVVMVITFIHPWLAPNAPQKTVQKIRHSAVFTSVFVFALAYSYTMNLRHSLIITILHFYLKTIVLKMFSTDRK